MSLKIALFYFTGTGNTEKVIELLADSLKKRTAQVDITRMEDVINGKKEAKTEEYDMVGFAYPIHAFNAPEIVFDFLKFLPKTKEKKAFILFVAGDPIYMNQAGSLKTRKILKTKGYDVFYERHFAMACNMIFKYSDGLLRQLYDAAVRKTDIMAADLLNNKQQILRPGLTARTLVLLSKAESKMGAPFFGKQLRASNKCTMCGLCKNICPRRNISDQSGKIVFGGRCIFCMRCIYSCPTRAIYSKGFQWTIIKEGYNTKDVEKEDKVYNDCVTEKTKGYYKHFYDYINND